MLRFGDTSAFKTQAGTFVTLSPSGGVVSVADPVQKHTFTVHPAFIGQVSIRSAAGKYVRPQSDGALAATSDSLTTAEAFTWRELGSGQVALRASNGKFVRAESSGALRLIADADGLAAGTVFKLIRDELFLRGAGQFLRVWNDKNSGGDQDVTFFHPTGVYGGGALSHIVQRSHSTTCEESTVGVEEGVGSSMPMYFQEVWNDRGSGATANGSLWRPVPKPGFVAMGHGVSGNIDGTAKAGDFSMVVGLISLNGYAAPSTSSIRCVRSDFVMEGDPEFVYWDKGSGANMDLSAWRVVARPGTEHRVYAPNTFIGVGNYEQPTAPVYVLKRFGPEPASIIRSALGNGLVLSIDPAAPTGALVVRTFSPGDLGQQWILRKLRAGYVLINMQTGLAASVAAGNGNRVTQVLLGAINEGSTWTFGGPAGQGRALRPLRDANQNLNVFNSNTASGSAVGTWDWSGGAANEVWSIDEIVDSTVYDPNGPKLEAGVWSANLSDITDSVVWVRDFRVRYSMAYEYSDGMVVRGPWWPLSTNPDTYFGDSSWPYALPKLVNLSRDPSGKTVARRIYRQFRGSPEELLARIPNNTDTEFLDLDHGPPKPPSFGIWYANSTDITNSVVWVRDFRVRYSVAYEYADGTLKRGPWGSYFGDGSWPYAMPQLVDLAKDGTGKAVARRIYRQFLNRPEEMIGRIADNTTVEFSDVDPGPPKPPGIGIWYANLSDIGNSLVWVPNFRVRYSIAYEYADGTLNRGPWGEFFGPTNWPYAFPQLANIPCDPTGKAIARLIYRHFDGQNEQLVGRIPNNTATEFGECDPTPLSSSLSIPGKTGVYDWKSSWTLPEAGHSAITFTANTIDDVYIALSAQKGNASPMYEIIIGGWNNTMSVIRRSSGGAAVATATTGLLRSGGANNLWVSVNRNTGLVQVGREAVGQNIILSYRDPELLSNVQCVAFSSWANAIQYSEISTQPLPRDSLLLPATGRTYDWADSWVLSEASRGAISFTAQTSNDVILALSSQRATRDPMYEIVIGGWGNTQTAIRRVPGGNPVATAPVGLLNPNGPNPLWVSINRDAGLLQVGRGNVVGTDVILSYRDPSFMTDIRYYAFSTWDKAVSYSAIASHPAPTTAPMRWLKGSLGAQGTANPLLRTSVNLSAGHTQAPAALIATPNGDNWNDTFAITTSGISATSSTINVYRSDAASGWGQNLGVALLAADPVANTGLQAGSFVVGGSGTPVKSGMSVTFPRAFGQTPRVLVTPRGGDYGDTFGTMTYSTSPTGFLVNVSRLNGSAWAQDLRLDWVAFTPDGLADLRATQSDSGIATIGTGGTGTKRVQVTFSRAFPSVPAVFLTPRGEGYADTFAVTATNVTTTGFIANVKRTDAIANGWGQNIMLDWLALV